MNFDSFSAWALAFLESSLFVTEILFSVISVVCLVGCLVAIIILARRRDNEELTDESNERFSRKRVIQQLRRSGRSTPQYHHGRGHSHRGAHERGRSWTAEHHGITDHGRPRFVLPVIDEGFGELLREYYAALSVLNLKPRASLDEIKAAYRGLVKKYHPDASAGSGDPLKTEKMQVATHAYHRLLDLEKDVEFQTKLSLLHRDDSVEHH